MQIPRIPLVEHAHPHTPEGFVRQFHDPRAEVRCWVHWDKLLTANVSVSETFVSEKEEIGSLETAWYHHADWSLAEWQNQEAKRALVREVSKMQDLPSPRSKERIASFVSMLDETPEGTIISVPALRAGEHTIILDGNHRSSAVYQSKRNFTLRLVVLECREYDPFLLPDLVHLTHAGASSEDWADICSRVREDFLIYTAKQPPMLPRP